MAFAWPNLMLADPPAMDVRITTDLLGIVISDMQRTLATFDTNRLSISGSDGEDHVCLPNSKLITEGLTGLQLGKGIDEVSFQSPVQLNFDEVPSGSLSGLNRLNLLGQPGDFVSISSESLSNATAGE